MWPWALGNTRGALEPPPGTLAAFWKKCEILMRITTILRDNFPKGIITFRAAQRGLFEIAAILRFLMVQNIEEKLTCVHARVIPMLVVEPLTATSVRRCGAKLVCCVEGPQWQQADYHSQSGGLF